MKKSYTLGNRKVAIIGAGFDGSSIAYALAIKDIAREIVLIDKTMPKRTVKPRISDMVFRAWGG